MRENVKLNRAYGIIVALLGDAKDIVQTNLHEIADRVLMPLPQKAFEYLPNALSALKQTRGIIHYYDFEHADTKDGAVEKVSERITQKLQALETKFYIPFGRIARNTGPNWYQVMLDIHVSKIRKKHWSQPPVTSSYDERVL